MVGRDKNGRFVKGHPPSNKGNGGRLPRKKEERYLRALTRCCRMKDWETIVDTAVARAKTGDAVAREWLSKYLMGPPPQKHEIDIDASITVTFISNVNDEQL